MTTGIRIGQNRFTISELTEYDSDWEQYVAVITRENQKAWFDSVVESSSRHFVAAKQDGHTVGFLVYVVREIGRDCVSPNGEALTEADIKAFGVQEAYRRQALGGRYRNTSSTQRGRAAVTRSVRLPTESNVRTSIIY